jgi:hypothetical protein
MIYENPISLGISGNQSIRGKGIYGKVHFKHLAVGVIPMDEMEYLACEVSIYIKCMVVGNPGRRREYG